MNEEVFKIRSKKDFCVYYFVNIMEVTSDLYTDEKLRLQAIIELMKEYRSIFPVTTNYSLARLWKKIKKYYDDNFCEIHYLSDELEKKLHEQH